VRSLHQSSRLLQMISCKNTRKTRRKKLTKNLPINRQKGQQGVEDGDDPQRRKRGNRSGKKELFDLQRVVLKKEKELEAVARHLDPDPYLKRSKGIYEALTSKEENLSEKIGKEKSKKMIAPIDEIKPPSARQRKQGEGLPPRLLGYFP
jgi:hypothetical protein